MTQTWRTMTSLCLTCKTTRLTHILLYLYVYILMAKWEHEFQSQMNSIKIYQELYTHWLSGWHLVVVCSALTCRTKFDSWVRNHVWLTFHPVPGTASSHKCSSVLLTAQPGCLSKNLAKKIHFDSFMVCFWKCSHF